MNKEPVQKSRYEKAFATKVSATALRKIKARRNTPQAFWSGLGMMGMIGWSIAVPTLLGAALGIWLDKLYPGTRSWTLALLVAGLAVGCFNAWKWVVKEERAMRDEHSAQEGHDD